MKHHFIILFCLLITATPLVNAQQKTNPEAEKMLAERMEYVKSELTDLSKTENKAFWPVYKKFLNSEMSLHAAFRTRLAAKGIRLNLPGNNKEVYDKLTDSQLTYLQDQRFQLKKDLLSLELNYYTKYKAILSPRNLIEFYRVDEEFKRNICHKMKTLTPEVQSKLRR